MDSKKLMKVQQRLKVGKNHYNKFGKFSYRSCEDILEALKPLLKEEELEMLISDSIISVGDLVFVEATITLYDGVKVLAQTTASAGHPKEMAGMSLPQITGACSSYARKYALSGLFLLDDSKEVDDAPVEKTEMTPEHPLWDGAKKKLAEKNTTLAKIRESFKVSEENAKLLVG